ncbi:MAG: BREX-1 system phosphatase PglZ type B [Desulfovibrionales bacterium]|nr:MAG: BREX-1 system phosphatase PglZ type B [Desulfovibrionales bacterium]
MRVHDHLLKAIRSAAVFNPEIQVAPACILWPDHDRQWEPIIPRLQLDMPELFVLGEYAPEKRTGPGIWLRCVIADTVEESSGLVDASGKKPPAIIYLPGVSRQDMRAVESCPEHLKPLAELQYRGVIWSQINAKDWTILAWLKSDQGGLGLDVAQDNEAKNAMKLALYRLLDEEVELLRGKRLDSIYFHTIITGDPVRDLLLWLNQGEAFQVGRGPNEWKAFVAVCKSQLAFNPQKEGPLAGAAKLATHQGPWQAVWDRYCEAPLRYPNIPNLIRKCPPPAKDMFWIIGHGTFNGWPQWNEDQEKSLRNDLHALNSLPPHKARTRILELEKQHGPRRKLVWAELGEAPLALALEHLAILADVTKAGLNAGSVDDLAAGYRVAGWKADDSMVRALAQIEKSEDMEAVATAIRAAYIPWAEESARYLQKIWDGNHESKRIGVNDDGSTCVLFVDGLRFDCALRLTEMLENTGYSVQTEEYWAALPSVTGTGKPAVAPINHKSHRLAEEPDGYNFEVMSSHHLRKAIEENGYALLSETIHVHSRPLTVQKSWHEFGNIDHEGHTRGWKLARQIDVLLTEIREHVTALLQAGWKTIRIVTDHGWLFLPGGLPKIELPSALSDNKWGRCAALKPGAMTEERLFPWYWNSNRYFALADGISCFKKGEEYAHGGLSLQECLLMRLRVSMGQNQSTAQVEITDVKWTGLRCKVAVLGHYSGIMADVRLNAGDAGTSVVMSVKPLNENGMGSVIVENDDMEGREAFLVLIDAGGSPVAQLATVIGGGQE